jgi:hypothetical protein
VRGHVSEAERALGRKRAGEALDGVGIDPAGDGVEDHQQGDEHHHYREHRGVLDRANHDSFDEDSKNKGKQYRQHEGPPVGDPGVDQAPGDVGGEHRHFALGEVHVVRRLVDHHQRERQAGIDAAGGEAGEHLVQERFHQ